MNSEQPNLSIAPKKRRRSDRGQHGDIQRAELTLPSGMWREIREYLFSDLSREYACYLLCGQSIRGSTIRLLGCFLILPQPSDYISHSLASVQLKQSLLAEVLHECSRLGLSLIDLHSHPFADQHVSFSGTDEADEREKAEWFSQNLPQCVYGSIVLGQSSHQARLRSTQGKTRSIPLALQPLEIPLLSRHEPDSNELRVMEVDRHVRAFGLTGQNQMSKAHVGIVGLGGLGSGVATGLSRLGVGHFTLIDPDRAEQHNLNRLFGMTHQDGEIKIKKTHLVRRELRRINRSTRCHTYTRSVMDRAAWSALLDCDLIVACTDNHASRMLLNSLSEQYLIPQVSIGSLIETENSDVKSACGHVRVLLPGPRQPCLLCSQIIDPTEVYYERVPEKFRREAVRRGYISNFDEPAPAVVHLNGVLIHLALVEIHNLFCGFKNPSPYLFYDLLNQEILNISEDPTECAACSPSGGYFGRGDLVKLANVFDELLPK